MKDDLSWRRKMGSVRRCCVLKARFVASIADVRNWYYWPGKRPAGLQTMFVSPGGLIDQVDVM